MNDARRSDARNGHQGDAVALNGQSGPSRRAVLQGAAWSVPVVALAAAAPRAAASGQRTVSIAFAVLVAELRWEDVFAGVVSITNDSNADIVDETATLTISGLAEDGEFSTSYSPTATQLQDENGTTPVQNSELPETSQSVSTFTASSSAFSLARGETIVVGFLLTRPAMNVSTKVFFIAGSFTLGGTVSDTTVGDDRLVVTLPDEE